MNDDTPFLDADLVSAYLDNEATAEERARVEASPELIAQVAELTLLRTNLRAVAPAPAGVRETAMAAAMAAFGTADIVADTAADAAAGSGMTDSQPSVAPAVASVISLAARRQRMYRVVTGVAAASVLAIGGLAVLNNRSGNDLESAAFETTISAAKAQTAAPAETTAAAAEAEAVVAGGAPAETAAAADTAAPAESTPAVEMVAEPDIAATPSNDLPVIATTADLAAYVAIATADDGIRTTSGTDPSAPADVAADPFGAADTCPSLSPRLDTSTDRVLGLVLFAGEQSFVVRRGDGSVQVVSAFTCAVLTQLPPS